MIRAFISYNTLIDVCQKNAMLEKALEIFAWMQGAALEKLLPAHACAGYGCDRVDVREARLRGKR